MNYDVDFGRRSMFLVLFSRTIAFTGSCTSKRGSGGIYLSFPFNLLTDFRWWNNVPVLLAYTSDLFILKHTIQAIRQQTLQRFLSLPSKYPTLQSIQKGVYTRSSKSYKGPDLVHNWIVSECCSFLSHVIHEEEHYFVRYPKYDKYSCCWHENFHCCSSSSDNLPIMEISISVIERIPSYTQWCGYNFSFC